MIETRLLHYFLAVAREQNITKAAESLYVTQSTLSKQMMDLEKQLGKQLFIRGKRKLTLTEDGYFLRDRAQEIMELLDNTESVFHADEEILSGHITIGLRRNDCDGLYRRSFWLTFTSVILMWYCIRTVQTLTAFSERLDKGLADMGLLLGPIRQEKYDYMNIRQKDIYGLLMPKNCELAKQEMINIDQLKSIPLIMSEQTFSGHQVLEMVRLGLFGYECGCNL